MRSRVFATGRTTGRVAGPENGCSEALGKPECGPRWKHLSIEAMGAKAVIAPKHNRKVQREYGQILYKQRNLIERRFSKLKHFRRFATRYEKTKNCFQSLVAPACSWIILQLYVDTA